jgi:hypothetical protein
MSSDDFIRSRATGAFFFEMATTSRSMLIDGIFQNKQTLLAHDWTHGIQKSWADEGFTKFIDDAVTKGGLSDDTSARIRGDMVRRQGFIDELRVALGGTGKEVDDFLFYLVHEQVKVYEPPGLLGRRPVSLDLEDLRALVANDAAMENVKQEFARFR